MACKCFTVSHPHKRHQMIPSRRAAIVCVLGIGVAACSDTTLPETHAHGRQAEVAASCWDPNPSTVRFEWTTKANFFSPFGSWLWRGYDATITAVAYDRCGNRWTGSGTMFWGSSNNGVFFLRNISTSYVNGSSNVVTAREVGFATLTASIQTASATPHRLDVTWPTLHEIRIWPNEGFGLNVGNTRQFTSRAWDLNGRESTNHPVTWQSSRTDVASISSSGLVTALKSAPAPAEITATNGHVTSLKTDVWVWPQCIDCSSGDPIPTPVEPCEPGAGEWECSIEG
jgi:hypothetical protein